MNIESIKEKIVIQGLRLNAEKCVDFLGLKCFAYRIDETLELGLSDEKLIECARHVQKGLLMPDLA